MGISVTWYTQLESGADITVSPALLRRLADVLGLTELERVYLFTLAIEEMGVLSSVLPEFEILAGARIAGESFNDEIAMVLRTHRTLKIGIYSALVHGTLDHLEPHLDETRCPIGFWLQDDLRSPERRSAGYTRAARVHAAFHREIDKVVHAALTGDVACAERLLVTPSRYVIASAALERVFSTWPLANAS